MEKRSFSTIGRVFYPGYELKISCERDASYLEDYGLKDRFRIVYIKEGHGIFRNGDLSQIVTSPAVLCLNEVDVVELGSGPGLSMDIMYFEPTCFEPYVPFADLKAWRDALKNDNWYFRPFSNRSETCIGAYATNYYLGKRISQLIEKTEKELSAQRDESWPCRSRSYLIELLILVNSIYDEDSDYENIYYGRMTDEIREVIQWLHIRYLDKLTMETVTRQFKTNKTTLNQKSKAVMGMTVLEYVANLRMQIACSLLRKTYLPVNEIMDRAGYKDDAHFLRTFKKHVGCTPSEYRNRHLAPE